MTYQVVVSDSKMMATDIEVQRAVLGEVDAEIVTERLETVEDVIEAVRDRDALIVDAEVPVTAAVLSSSDSLQVVGRAGIGVDNVELDAAWENDVAVVHVPTYSIDEVATHALSLALSCLRRVPQFDRHVKGGGWDWRVGRPIPRLKGSTIGLIAFGKIPRRLATMLSGFGVEVLCYDPYVSSEEMAEYDVESVSFDEVLSRSDVLSVHPPLTDETRGMIDAEAFETMRDDAILVNTSRGPVVDEDALYDALVEGEIAAAGIDVMAEEPPEASPLFDLDSVVCTPHVAWYSEESRQELSRDVASDVASVLEGKEPDAPVTPDTEWI